MGYAPFELIYGHMPQMAITLLPTNLPGVKAFAQCTLDHLQGTHDAIIKSHIDQLILANKHRWPDSPMLKLGELAYISTKNLSLPKGQASKLLPKYIRPYKILEVFPDSSNYVLKLPPELEHGGIFLKFHISHLAPHEPNDSLIFPGWAAQIFYDFGDNPEREYQVSEIVTHTWDVDNCLWFHVKWGIGDLTWEPLSNVDDIMALDEFLTLQDVDKVENLQRVRIPSEFNTTPTVDLPRSAWLWKPSTKLCMQIMQIPMEGQFWH